ncbi:MAG: bacteriohemerythrin [Bryobacteraceae bacterium]|jgi:hemerythrin
MMFDWQPEYSVRFAEIDGLHQQVFRAAGELHAAIVAGEAQDTLAELLARLVSCTQKHFAAEEALMQSSQYPQTARHKAAHEALGERLLACEQGAKPSVEMMQTLKNWVIQHIDEEDRELGRHLASRAGQ